MKVPAWWPEWAYNGQDRPDKIMIVASGPSASKTPLERAQGIRCIAVNTSYQLVPWADVLFSSDAQWWKYHGGAADFGGLKLIVGPPPDSGWGLHRIKAMQSDERVLMETPGVIGWGNSGFMAFNLAMQMYPHRIILVGYDMHMDGGSHWHGDHPEPMHNPRLGSFAKWRNQMEKAGDVADRLDIEVVNCSLTSNITRYPKMNLDEALECCNS